MTGTPAANLTLMQQSTRAHRDRHKTFANLKLSMFIITKTPWAYSPRLKAQSGDIRHLGPCLCVIFEGHRDNTDFRHRMIRLGLKQDLRMEEVLDEHPGVLEWPRSAAQDFCTATFQYVACLKRLQAHFASLSPSRKLFNVTIKAHYLAHGGYQALWIHPRAGWCYGGKTS